MKTVLVTGASDGIGRETARQISEKRHQVFIHGRSLEKAAKTAADLAQTVPDARLIPVYADLSDMHQVLDLAKQVRDKTAVLDVLINNAGVFEERRTVTRDGFEMTMAVNHFAHFLLSLQLLDLLKAAPQGRIITVSSIAHGMGTIDLNDLTFKHHYSGYDAYAVSKLANILFTMALGARLTGTPVTANSLHPGVISTKLLHKGFGIGGDNVEKGARTSVYLATSNEAANISGKYFIDCKPSAPSRTARDVKLAERLWKKTEELLQPFIAASPPPARVRP